MSAAEDKVMQPATIEFELDGRKVRAIEGETILQAAERDGTVIPRLCYTPGYRADGNCRGLPGALPGGRRGARWPTPCRPCHCRR